MRDKSAPSPDARLTYSTSAVPPVVTRAAPRLERQHDNRSSRHVTHMDDTLEQPKPSSNLNTSSTIDDDREEDSSGDEDGGLDWTKLPYVPHPPT